MFFKFADKAQLASVLKQYELPLEIDYDKEKVIKLMSMDKKKDNDSINYILLNKHQINLTFMYIKYDNKK